MSHACSQTHCPESAWSAQLGTVEDPTPLRTEGHMDTVPPETLNSAMRQRHQHLPSHPCFLRKLSTLVGQPYCFCTTLGSEDPCPPMEQHRPVRRTNRDHGEQQDASCPLRPRHKLELRSSRGVPKLFHCKCPAKPRTPLIQGCLPEPLCKPKANYQTAASGQKDTSEQVTCSGDGLPEAGGWQSGR